MSRTRLFVFGVGGLIAAVSMVSGATVRADDPFQLLSSGNASGAQVTDVRWPVVHGGVFHRHHHHVHRSYVVPRYHVHRSYVVPRYHHHYRSYAWRTPVYRSFPTYRHYSYGYSYGYPSYCSPWVSSGFSISLGPIRFSTSPSYGGYAYPSYVSSYAPYDPCYGAVYDAPYVGVPYVGATGTYFSFGSTAPPQTNIYVIAPQENDADEAPAAAGRLADNVVPFAPIESRVGPVADDAPLFVGVQRRPAAKASAVDALQTLIDNLPSSDAADRARSRRLIEAGDRYFASQKYASALSQYKLAVAAAPDSATAYFREGNAFIATGEYDLAARAFKLGARLTRDLANDGASLDSLYASNSLAKNARLEAVAQTALVNRDNADLLFLVGAMLHFDGQTERAALFFENAAKTATENVDHLRPFTPAGSPQSPAPLPYGIAGADA